MKGYPEKISLLTIPPHSQLIPQPRRRNVCYHSVLLFTAEITVLIVINRQWNTLKNCIFWRYKVMEDLSRPVLGKIGEQIA